MKMIKHNPSTFPSIWDEVFDLYPFKNGGESISTPAVNISETNNEYKIELAASGLTKEEIHVEIENDLLSIKSEHSEKKSEEKESYTRREFNYRSFNLSFKLPKGKVDSEQVQASYENGVLYVSIPKMEKASLTKKIKVS